MLTIDLQASDPIADQIVAGVRAAIARGEVGEGDELPSVRQLAVDLRINLNTVARAYRVLEGEGLIRSQRGRGTRVISTRARTPDTRSELHERVKAALDAVLADAKLAGMGARTVESLFRKRLGRFWPAVAESKGRGTS